MVHQDRVVRFGEPMIAALVNIFRARFGDRKLPAFGNDFDLQAPARAALNERADLMRAVGREDHDFFCADGHQMIEPIFDEALAEDRDIGQRNCFRQVTHRRTIRWTNQQRLHSTRTLS